MLRVLPALLFLALPLATHPEPPVKTVDMSVGQYCENIERSTRFSRAFCVDCLLNRNGMIFLVGCLDNCPQPLREDDAMAACFARCTYRAMQNCETRL
jgi:hypothetical protein